MTTGAADDRFAGTSVPEPEFPGDDGSADPALTQVMGRHVTGHASAYDVVAELAGARLLVPVVAVLDSDEAGPDGRRQEKDSHMATVTLVNPDGRRGLLAFTSVQALQAWDRAARPVAARLQRVAQAALAEGADAVLLDIAGPAPFPLEGAALSAVAAGQPWLPAHLDPTVAAAVRHAIATATGAVEPGAAGQAVGGQRHGLSYRIGAGAQSGGDLFVEVEGAGDPDAVRRLLASALAADPDLVRRCPAGIALRVT